jgi:hypothetical protein
MLKVLLAPELPNELLSAPRRHYGSSIELAKAADVSPMSASRFVRQFQREGYLEGPRPYLSIVRRADLLRRWQAASEARPAREVSVRFLLPVKQPHEFRRMMQGGDACLGLFAAADALRLGFVHGVPPHVYVRHSIDEAIAEWKNVIPAELGEPPNAIVRRAATPRSIFRAVVKAKDVLVCDVLQIWLDVSSHPARGREQADLIWNRVISRLTGEGPHGG